MAKEDHPRYREWLAAHQRYKDAVEAHRAAKGKPHEPMAAHDLAKAQDAYDKVSAEVGDEPDA